MIDYATVETILDDVYATARAIQGTSARRGG